MRHDKIRASEIVAQHLGKAGVVLNEEDLLLHGLKLIPRTPEVSYV
jgi:hypothetical protein